MCKFGANRTTSTAKVMDSRSDIFAMAKMGRVSGFWRFLGKYLGTGQKIPYWEPTGENPWISGPEYIPTLSDKGWLQSVGYIKLLVIFRKSAMNYNTNWWKMTKNFMYPTD